jgi:hypothetical protein
MGQNAAVWWLLQYGNSQYVVRKDVVRSPVVVNYVRTDISTVAGT